MQEARISSERSIALGLHPPGLRAYQGSVEGQVMIGEPIDGETDHYVVGDYSDSREEEFYARFFSASDDLISDAPICGTKIGAQKSLKDLARNQVWLQVGELAKQLLCALYCGNKMLFKDSIQSLRNAGDCLCMHDKEKSGDLEKIVYDALGSVLSQMTLEGLIEFSEIAIHELVGILESGAQSVQESEMSKEAACEAACEAAGSELSVEKNQSVERCIAETISLVLRALQAKVYLEALKELREFSAKFNFSEGRFRRVSEFERRVIGVIRTGVSGRICEALICEELVNNAVAFRKSNGNASCEKYCEGMLQGLPNSLLLAVWKMISDRTVLIGLEGEEGQMIRKEFRSAIATITMQRSQDLNVAIRSAELTFGALSYVNKDIQVYVLRKLDVRCKMLSRLIELMDKWVDVYGFRTLHLSGDPTEWDCQLTKGGRAALDEFERSLRTFFLDSRIDSIVQEMNGMSLGDLRFLEKFSQRYWPALQSYVLQALENYRRKENVPLPFDKPNELEKCVSEIAFDRLSSIVQQVDHLRDPQNNGRKKMVLNAVIDRVQRESEGLLLQLLDVVRAMTVARRGQGAMIISEYSEFSDLGLAGDLLISYVQLLVDSNIVPKVVSESLNQDIDIVWDRTRLIEECWFAPVPWNDCLGPGCEKVLGLFYKTIVTRLRETRVISKESEKLLDMFADGYIVELQSGSVGVEAFQPEVMRQRVSEMTLPALVSSTEEQVGITGIA